MSIVTRTGDHGETSLLFGRRIAKTDPRIEAVGAVDELNAALGVVRATGGAAETVDLIDRLQGRLVGLMGELGILPEDAGRYAEKGYAVLGEADVVELDGEAARLEGKGLNFEGWARPGAAGSLVAAHLDVARTICRRAERRVLALGEGVANGNVAVFLNRVSDVLWLMARDEEGG
ncbi:MAG: cob(I)yrinic acid a,c-diamide adenosyltransferase [Verrucomicrobia bacterium]|nr:cob(I)yrinic acid a,c-diamide adenosyltransferase [Verrucomicrobiota bacterium]